MRFALLLLFLADPWRLMLFDETVEAPARGWEEIGIQLEQRPAVVECRYRVENRRSVRVMLLDRGDFKRFERGAAHRVLAGAGFGHSGAFRFGPGRTGDYSVVIDNRMEGRGPAHVHLEISLVFPGAEARELSPQRKAAVILITIAVMGAIVWFSVSRLKGALLGRPPG
jgi:hypothetical protein